MIPDIEYRSEFVPAGTGRGYNSKSNWYFLMGLKIDTQIHKHANNDSCDVSCMKLFHLFAQTYLFPHINGVDMLLVGL